MSGASWERESDDDLLLAARSEPAAFGAFYGRHEDIVGFRSRRQGMICMRLARFWPCAGQPAAPERS